MAMSSRCLLTRPVKNEPNTIPNMMQHQFSSTMSPGFHTFVLSSFMPSPLARVICMTSRECHYQAMILFISDCLSRSETLTIGSLDRTGIPAAVVYAIGLVDLSGELSDGKEAI